MVPYHSSSLVGPDGFDTPDLKQSTCLLFDHRDILISLVNLIHELLVSHFDCSRSRLHQYPHLGVCREIFLAGCFVTIILVFSGFWFGQLDSTYISLHDSSFKEFVFFPHW